ncbi:MAG: GatB/YqeY domain-containing protein [bacterium]|nr:GatB/YqeY domain-containing protein [bacterium]
MKDWKKEIDAIIKESLKSKDMVRANVVRMLKADLTNDEIRNKTDLTEEQVLQVIQRAVKKRKESIDEFKKAGKEDRVQEEENELKYLAAFLPEQVSEEELARVVEETIKELNPSGMKDFGKVMSAVMQKVKGRADGKMVNESVRKKLPQ